MPVSRHRHDVFAFVGGGVVMTSANEELPAEKGGRIGWFGSHLCWT